MTKKRKNIDKVPNTSQKIPKLRFPEFAGDWEAKKLGNISPLQRGFDLPKQSIVAGNIPIVYSNGILKFHNQSKSKAPGLVTGRSGTIGKFTFIENGEYWPHNTSLWVTDFCGNIPKFIYYLYQTINIEQFSTGSGVPTLNRNDVHRKKCSIPNIEEQKKISSFLSLLDEKLQTQRKTIQNLETLIKGVSQKLFTRKIRFKEFTDEWKEVKLGKIGETFNGLTGKTKDDFGKGKPYIQYKQIFDSTKIQIQDCELVEISEKDNQNCVKYGDVFFTTSSETPNEIGMSSVLLDEVDEMYLNSFCFGYRTFSFDILTPLFASFFFRSSVFRNKIVKLAQGSTRYNMSKVELMKLSISLPSIQEQTKIADFLSKISDKIENEKKILELLEQQKKYFLQNMFI